MSSKSSSPPNPDLQPSTLALTLLAAWTLSIAVRIGISAAPTSFKAIALSLLTIAAVASVLSHSTHPPADPADFLPTTRAIRTHALLLWRHAGHLRWTLVARRPQSAAPFRRLRIYLRFPPRSIRLLESAPSLELHHTNSHRH